MKTKAFIFIYFLTKLLVLALFFFRLEGRRAAMSYRRAWRKHA